MDETKALFITVNGVKDLINQPLKINAASLLKQLQRESPLTGEEAQEVLKLIVDGNLPVEHAQQLIAAGADVNHSYPGMENLLHLAWKHVKENSNNGKAIFNLLLETASLDPRSREFYADVDPDFLRYYASVAPQQPNDPSLKTKLR